MREHLRAAFERTLADYFRERLDEQADTIPQPPNEDTRWYMASLLARFGSSDQLFCYEQGNLTLRPLALLYKDAHETADNRQRCLILRQLGDMALYIGALFPERYARRGIRKDYFIGMGGGAYDYLADNAPHSRHIYSELAEMFNALLELVAKVCLKQNPFDAADILSLYRRWRDTGDELIAKHLRAAGIDTQLH